MKPVARYFARIAPFGAVLLAGGLGLGCSDGTATPPPGGIGGTDAQGGLGGGATIDSGAGGASGGGELMPLPSVARIMAIGDSVTRATCWRARLWEQLNQSFPSRFDLVGTLQSDSGCMPAAYDRDNQGYSSSLVTEIVAGITTRMGCDPSPCPNMANLEAAFAAATPDLVLMHFGTNDVWNAKAPTEIINAYSVVVDALRAANPNVRVLVAQIIPMNVTPGTCAGCTCDGCTCAGCPSGIQTLNMQIATWATSKATTQSPIYVVDQWTGFDTTPDTRDGVHPNEAGSQKMADDWFAALQPLFTAAE